MEPTQSPRTLPGRFPSPTPPIESPSSNTFHEYPPAPHTPVNRSQNDTTSASADTVNHTFAAFVSRRPNLTNANSEDILSDILRREQGTSTAGLRSHPRPISRPYVHRNAASDPRHDRSRNRINPSYGSPRGRRRPGPRNASGNMRNEQAGPSADPNPAKEASDSRRLHEKLRSKISQDITPLDMTKGEVYILRDPSRPHLLKIGSSGSLYERIGSLESKCRLQLEIVKSWSLERYYSRAERLAHTDLGHLIRYHGCICGTENHEEWHEVEEYVAIATVERWVKFVRLQPYNCKGNLKSIWEHVFIERQVDLLAKDFLDHDTRWIYWHLMLAPLSTLDHYKYMSGLTRDHLIWNIFWEYPWQLSGVVSWSITYFVLQSTCTFRILLSCIACAGVKISGELSPIKPTLAKPIKAKQ